LILKELYKNYWRFGFISYLYDLLTPTAYLNSIESIANSVILSRNSVILDVGCGTGQTLPFLKNSISNGAFYVGIDVLKNGLIKVNSKSKKLTIEKNVICLQTDFTQGLPIKVDSVDFIICHFASYIINNLEDRKRLFNDFFEILKSGGSIAIANPSIEYCPEKIIHESLLSDIKSKTSLIMLIWKYLIYSLAKFLGLNYIKSQLQSGVWKGFTKEELINDTSQAGFDIISVKEVYGKSAFLVVAEKR
jgi:ubiquinone/menaquinone biosynthesis C-methylase UbiE